MGDHFHRINKQNRLISVLYREAELKLKPIKIALLWAFDIYLSLIMVSLRNFTSKA
ncbi:hypothetical protein CSUIS_0517 [Campylobacter porcelli]|uniref:Uncharacterized protein n=1 Tax=Campylobacter porcelli TaxID=1660073 RepID=A0A1X9SVK7_9BACT|nr:hypothetical protein CSUIS_0517 [Campylobacter sp. RM6137]